MPRSRRQIIVVEGTYRTGHQEHVYIEPNGVIAVPEDGGVAVFGSVQCPFYVIKALKCLLGTRRERFAWCRPRRAADSAERKNIRR